MYDPFNALGESWEHPPLFPDNSDASNIMRKYNLEKNMYILLNRDVDASFTMQHPKLWPIEYYDRLIRLMKNKNPKLKMIQVGVRRHNNTMTEIDYDLTGKTSLTEIKTILKNSRFLISGEGGLVHVMNFTGGRSVVLFGPTDEKYFGYKDNLECVNRGECEEACNYIHEDYWRGCMKGSVPSKCMKNLTPEFVFDRITTYQWT
jgi:ADP-heptose:LPS heptosyltransferase